MRRSVLSASSCILLVLSIGCAFRAASPDASPLADDPQLEALVEAMGQRLALMPQVAEWKRARGRPVRDRPRELQVLDNAVAAVDAAARQAGVGAFPELAVRDFYQAQIDAAVEIQTQVLSRPAESGVEPADLGTVIRPELDRLGARIAELLVTQRNVPDRVRLEQLAREHWRVEGLGPEARLRLVAALERLLATVRISTHAIPVQRVKVGSLRIPVSSEIRLPHPGPRSRSDLPARAATDRSGPQRPEGPFAVARPDLDQPRRLLRSTHLPGSRAGSDAGPELFRPDSALVIARLALPVVLRISA